MKATHAVVVRIPNSLKFDDKKLVSKVDLPLARRQQQEFNDILRESGVDVIELSLEDNANVSALFIDDVAVVINGTALMTRPKRSTSPIAGELRATLAELAWNVVDTPAQEHGKTVVLEGSDVFYAGREIFVGIRKGGTNIEGALVVGRIFADIPVVPIPIGGSMPLKYYVSLAADNILTVSKSKESQSILHRIERDATFRYKIVTLENDDYVNCINLNGRLIFRPDSTGTRFGVLQSIVELWGVAASEMATIATPMSRFVLLVNRLPTARL